MSTPTVMDGYVRVSVVGGRQGERFQSPAAQREAIQRWADYKGIRIGEWFEDLDKSGGTLKRPGLQSILKRIERKDTGGIIVAKLDRLSRSVHDGLSVIEDIEKLGGQVVSTTDNIDTTSANGKLQLIMFLAMAQWYRESADEQLASAQLRAIARGALPGRTPYGTQRHDDGRVSLNEDQASVVARMVSERAAGKGWKAIATRLDRDRIPTPSGTGIWAASTIQGIVSSEACLGVFCGPRGVRIEDAWPAMVSRQTWDAAQAITGKRDAERRYQDRLFAGLARCANCRKTLKRTTNQQGHVSYGCTYRACPGRSSIGATALDSFLSELVNERLSVLTAKASEATDDTYDALMLARDDATAEFEAWRDDTEMRSLIGDADYRAGLKARAQMRDAANEAFNDHVRQSRSGLHIDVLPDDRTVALDDLPSWDHRRQVVEAYLHAVFVKPALRRGPAAAKDAAQRVRLIWSDDRDLPDLPSPVTGQLAPVIW